VSFATLMIRIMGGYGTPARHLHFSRQIFIRLSD
jgi:hypothetical protein